MIYGINQHITWSQKKKSILPKKKNRGYNGYDPNNEKLPKFWSYQKNGGARWGSFETTFTKFQTFPENCEDFLNTKYFLIM